MVTITITIMVMVTVTVTITIMVMVTVMVTEYLKTKSSLPLKWHGGKSYLAKQIIELFPSHVHYVEPFFGGGSVLFSKPKEWIDGHSEVVNDAYDGLVAFWRVLQNYILFSEFERRIAMVPFSETEWQDAGVVLGSVDSYSS